MYRGFALGLWAAYTTSEERKRVHLEEAAGLLSLAFDNDVTLIEKLTHSMLKVRNCHMRLLIIASRNPACRTPTNLFPNGAWRDEGNLPNCSPTFVIGSTIAYADSLS